MSIYPAQIDDSTTLPVVINTLTPVSASVVNSLRDAIIAIEQSSGVNPGSVYGTIRARLDFLEALIINGGGGGGGGGPPTGPAGGNLGGTFPSPIVISLQNHAVSSSNPSDGQVLTWSTTDNQWEPKTPSSGFTAGGDLTGSSSNQIVSKINGNPVIITSPQKSDILTYNGTSLINRATDYLNILDYGGNGNGITDNTTAFANASTAAASHPSGKIYIPAGTYKLNSIQSISGNLVFASGASIQPAASQTITLTGQIFAEDYQQIFNISLSSGIVITNINEINACWFGADPTQTSDSQPAIQAAIQCAKTANAVSFGVLTRYIRIPAGKYVIDKPIVNNTANCKIKGDGAQSTQIWAYSLGSPCVHYSNLSLMTLNAGAYAGGNTANLGDGPVLALHRYGPAWYLDGQAQFSLDCIFRATTTPQTQSTVLISSRGIDPDFNTGRNAFYLFLLAADNGYSNTNMALQWVLHTSSGTVTAQTNVGVIVPGSTFYNIRLDYDGSFMRIFVNGTAQTLTNADTKIAQTGTIVQHYAEGVSLGLGLTSSFWGTEHVYAAPQGGQMASLRLKWISQGSSNYSPPVAKFTEDADTKFLLNFDIVDALGGLHFARVYGGTLFGNVNAWLPNEDGSDVTKQISYNAIEDITLVADNGPAINLNACPNFLVQNCNLYGQSGVLVNENSYNSTIEKCNMFVSRDRVQGGGKGIGIWSAAASNYVVARDNVVTGFDVCFFSGESFALEGYNYFVQPRYAGIYLENSYAGSIGGNAFISDEGSAFDNPYGMVMAGCGCVDVHGILFGVAAHTDQYQILINNSSGSPTPNSHITITGVNLTSGVGQAASINVTHTRVGDEVILNGCAPGVNNIPLLSIDSTTLGRILVEPQENEQISIALADTDTTLDINQWSYGRLVFTGTLTATRTITVPSLANYSRWIQNNTNQLLLIKTLSGTGVVIVSGEIAHVTCDGVNIILDTANIVAIDGYAVIGSNAQISDVIAFNGTEWINRREDALNILDFGAVGDGATDDTNAIQAAIDAASHSATNVRKVFLPATNTIHSYKITKPLFIQQNNIVLEGENNKSSSILYDSHPGTLLAITPTGVAGTDPQIGSSLLTGVGNSMIYIPTAKPVQNQFFDLRDSQAFDLNGATALSIECTIKYVTIPTDISVIYNHSGNDGISSSIIVGVGFWIFPGSDGSHADLVGFVHTSSGTYTATLSDGVTKNTATCVQLSWNGTNLSVFSAIPGATTTNTTVSSPGTLVQNYFEGVWVGFGFSEAWPYAIQDNDVFDGYIDSLRISNFARNTANYTTSTTKFATGNGGNVNVGGMGNNTIFLCNFETYRGSWHAYTYDSVAGQIDWYIVNRASKGAIIGGTSNTQVRNLGLFCPNGRALQIIGTQNSILENLVIIGRYGITYETDCYYNSMENIQISDGSSPSSLSTYPTCISLISAFGGSISININNITLNTGAIYPIYCFGAIYAKAVNLALSGYTFIPIYVNHGFSNGFSTFEDILYDSENVILFPGYPSNKGNWIAAIGLENIGAISFKACDFDVSESNDIPIIAGPVSTTDIPGILSFDSCFFSQANTQISPIFSFVTGREPTRPVSITQSVWTNNLASSSQSQYVSVVDFNASRSITTGTNSTANLFDKNIGINVSTPYNLTTNAHPFPGQTLIIKDQSGNADTNNITITANSGQTIDGISTFVIFNKRGSVKLTYDGTSDWMVT